MDLPEPDGPLAAADGRPARRRRASRDVDDGGSLNCPGGAAQGAVRARPNESAIAFRRPRRARARHGGRSPAGDRKLVALGQQTSVRDTRSAFQVATSEEFIATIEQIVYRKVRAFASAIDPDANAVFEHFHFEALHSNEPS